LAEIDLTAEMLLQMKRLKTSKLLYFWANGCDLAALPSKVDASFVSSLSSFLESFPLIS
jgi:hypothetical protein